MVSNNYNNDDSERYEKEIDRYYDEIYSEQDRRSIEDSKNRKNFEKSWQNYLKEEDEYEMMREIEEEYHNNISESDLTSKIVNNNYFNDKPNFHEEFTPDITIDEQFEIYLSEYDLEYYSKINIGDVWNNYEIVKDVITKNSYQNIDSKNPIVNELSKEYINEIEKEPLKSPLLAHYYESIADVYKQYKGYERQYNWNILKACSIWRKFYKKTNEIEKNNAGINNIDLQIMLDNRKSFSKKADKLIEKTTKNKGDYNQKVYYNIKAALIMDLYPEKANEALNLAKKALNINLSEKTDSYVYKVLAKVYSLLGKEEQSNKAYKMSVLIEEKYKEELS